MHANTWHITARYRAYDTHGNLAHLARTIINLVNVQGPGTIAVTPPCLPDLMPEIDRLDSTRSWRSWWSTAAGENVNLADSAEEPVPPPHYLLVKTLAQSGTCLGINVGGHYLRLVWLTDGIIEHSAIIELGTGQESTLAGAKIDDFVNLVRHERSVANLTSIGIAWSAPRTTLGLRAMSLPMDNAGELGDLLHTGRIDAVLTQKFGVPVYSWNDGEAVVAAEVVTRSHDSTRPLLALKLGTSMASGLATADGVVALPMQLAKCVLSRPPLRKYEHPATGLFGTSRDMIGAESILRTYRSLMADDRATYDDFCTAALADVPIASRLVQDATYAITEISDMIGALWSPVDLVVTGKNIEREDYRDLFTTELTKSLSNANAKASLLQPVCDHDLVAAMGAVCLSLGRSSQLTNLNGEKGQL